MSTDTKPCGVCGKPNWGGHICPPAPREPGVDAPAGPITAQWVDRAHSAAWDEIRRDFNRETMAEHLNRYVALATPTATPTDDDGKTSTRKLCEYIVNSQDRIAAYRELRGPLVLIENSARSLARLCRIVSERILAGGVTNDDLAPLRVPAAPVPEPDLAAALAWLDKRITTATENMARVDRTLPELEDEAEYDMLKGMRDADEESVRVMRLLHSLCVTSPAAPVSGEPDRVVRWEVTLRNVVSLVSGWQQGCAPGEWTDYDADVLSQLTALRKEVVDHLAALRAGGPTP